VLELDVPAVRSPVVDDEDVEGSPLDPQRVLVVGDTPNDIAAAHAAGAIAVGVASGHSSEEELRRSGADYVLGSLLEELPGVAAPVS
jgi:phosphoglycolate phosphatase